ncbi:MAG: dihydrodipicolinate reductase [Desulfurococcaceae archaeon]
MNIGIVGYGEIGRLVLKIALQRGHNVISVVDIDDRLIDKDAGLLAGLEEIGIKVTNSLAGIEESDVVIHATSSYLDRVYSQLMEIISRGVNIVSTCETLAYPYYRYPILSRRIDEVARSAGVTVIGTGINPGFLLDTLVVAVASTQPLIEKIRAVRSIDAAKRRESFRKKIGIGKDPYLVKNELAKGSLTGHVGYAESVLLIASAGDLHLTEIEEKQEPVVAEETVESSSIRVDRGSTKGIIGYGAGFVNDKEVIRVEFYAYVGAPEYEEITIEGVDTSVNWRSSGTHGDLGTVSVVLSVAERIFEVPAGLRLMTELLPFKLRFMV